jgi:hypothetical protein
MNCGFFGDLIFRSNATNVSETTERALLAAEFGNKLISAAAG